MQRLKRPRPLHATCDHGLEAVLADELRALGAADVEAQHRGVAFTGARDLIWRANLALRTANRVLMPVAEFVADGRSSLYDAVKRVDWPSWFEVRHSIAVEATGEAPGLEHSGFVAQVTKDAVCDRFREVDGKRPSVDRRAPDVPLYVHLEDGRGVVGFDTSGARLHRRGYRIEAGPAPLKETLAAGVLALLDWAGETPLYDPMCGAGTFVIEAGLRSRGIAPGLLRLGRAGFAFERWRIHDPRGFRRVVDGLRAEIREAPAELHGTDADRDAVDLARRNARRAGIDVTWGQQPLESVTEPPTEASGLVVVNPPYGKRLEAGPEVYAELGRVLKHGFSGWRAGVLAATEAPAGAIGLRATERWKLRNGPLPCQLHLFELYSGSKR